jgi:hypothetical protein
MNKKEESGAFLKKSAQKTSDSFGLCLLHSQNSLRGAVFQKSAFFPASYQGSWALTHLSRHCEERSDEAIHPSYFSRIV